MRRLLPIVLAALLLAPAGAYGHAQITRTGGTLAYRSEDSGSRSRLEVRATLASVTISDPGAFGGMTAPFSCQPGRADERGNAYEWTCPANGVEQLRLDVGPDEDLVDVTGPFRRFVIGDHGADVIRTGDTQAEVRGGDGNDDIATGAAGDTVYPQDGSDTVATGGGDDRIESADGELDRIACGDGLDSVEADTVDQVELDCEVVERRFVEPPPGSSTDDGKRPALKVRAAKRQRAKRPSLRARSSEAGTVVASAYLRTSSRNLRVRPVRKEVRADRWERLRFRLSKSQVRRVRDDVRRGKRPKLAVRVAASDRAGNGSRARNLRIALR